MRGLLFKELKRVFEFVLSLALLIAFFPILFTISLLSFIDTKQFPIFSWQLGLALTISKIDIYTLCRKNFTADGAIHWLTQKYA